MKQTTNYGLNKPDPTDYINVEDLNQNMDKIDDELSKRVEEVAGKGLSTNDYTDTEKAEVAKVKNKAEKVDVEKHTADDNLNKHKAKQIELQDTANLFTSTNVEEGMSELFTNVSNGKDLVSGAITGVDDSVAIPTEPSFSDLASAIGGISTGKKWVSGRTTAGYSSSNKVTINTLDFEPSIFIYRFNEESDNNYYVGIFTKNDLGGILLDNNNLNRRIQYDSRHSIYGNPTVEEYTYQDGVFSFDLNYGSGYHRVYWLAIE